MIMYVTDSDMAASFDSSPTYVSMDCESSYE